MPRFRKKPVTVEAVQWFPGVRHPGLVGDTGRVYGDGGEYPAVVRTAHGHLTPVAPGDWIIAEPDGRGYYPCKPDIFEATYEPSEEV